MKRYCKHCIDHRTPLTEIPCKTCLWTPGRPNYKPKEKPMSKPSTITCPTKSQIIEGYKVNPELMEKLFPDVIKEYLEDKAEKDKYFDLGNPGKFIYSKDKTSSKVGIFIANGYKYVGNAFLLSSHKGIHWKLEWENCCLYLVPTKV